MAKRTMRRIDVVRRETGWVAELKGGGTFVEGSNKKDVVQQAAAKARKGSEPTTMRIHGKSGRIQEERTYPRSADSRSSKG